MPRKHLSKKTRRMLGTAMMLGVIAVPSVLTPVGQPIINAKTTSHTTTNPDGSTTHTTHSSSSSTSRGKDGSSTTHSKSSSSSTTTPKPFKFPSHIHIGCTDPGGVPMIGIDGDADYHGPDGAGFFDVHLKAMTGSGYHAYCARAEDQAPENVLNGGTPYKLDHLASASSSEGKVLAYVTSHSVPHADALMAVWLSDGHDGSYHYWATHGSHNSASPSIVKKILEKSRNYDGSGYTVGYYDPLARTIHGSRAQNILLVHKQTPQTHHKTKTKTTHHPPHHTKTTMLSEHPSYPVPIDMKISKTAKKSGKPMKNTHFDLVDASNGSVIASADTGDDGTAMFKNINHTNGHMIPAGTPLKIVETSTDQDHYTMNNQSMIAGSMPSTSWIPGHVLKWKKNKQNRPKMPSESHPSKDQSAPRIEAAIKSKEQSMVLGPFSFQDKAIINTPNIRSYAREPTDLGVVTGTQYVDAKKEHLKDTLDIHHLDGARQYKVVDTMENPETMQPAKINGQEVTGTQTFTAAAHYRDEHPNQQLTFDYPQVNLAGMANTDYIFQARIYDAKNNHLLGTEGDPMRGDDGSEMSDASQRIFVRKEHTHSQAHAGEDNDETGSNGTAHCAENNSAGLQTVNPYSHTRLDDDVMTDGLVPHHQYHIHEEVMEKSDDGKSVHPLHINGNTVEATKDFTADSTEDKINVHLPSFDTTQLNGKNLVIYYEVSPVSEESDILSEDHNPTDCNESIHITNPRLRSTATVDDDKTSNPSHYSHMTDNVQYSDVAPYQPMTIDTMLANKDNTAVEVPGDGTNRAKWNYVEGKVNTTPTSSSGDENVPQQEIGTGSDSKTSVNITKPSTRASLNKLNPIHDADYGTSEDKSAREADKGLSARVSGKINHDIYDIDTTSLRGQHPVFYDDLYNGDSQPITWHDDPDDKNETIYITNPKIWTEALLDNHKISNPNAVSRLKDLIRYKDVAPGHRLDFSSLAMDQKTGKPVVIHEQDHDFNLMGRDSITPDTANGKTKVPLEEVEDGQPAKTQNGSLNDTNTDNIKNMVVENVKDDRHVQHMKRAVASIQDHDDDARIHYHQMLTNDVNGLDSLVYDGKVGMPDNLIQACRDVENVIGDGSNVSTSDLNNITDKLNDVILDDCQNGDFLSQGDYHNRVQVYNETHDKSIKGANTKIGEATANNADNLPFTFTGTDGHMHTTTFGRMINNLVTKRLHQITYRLRMILMKAAS